MTDTDSSAPDDELSSDTGYRIPAFDDPEVLALIGTSRLPGGPYLKPKPPRDWPRFWRRKQVA